MNDHLPAAVLVAAILITLMSALAAGYVVLVYGPQMPGIVSAYVERLSLVYTAGAGAIFTLLAIWLSGGKK